MSELNFTHSNGNKVKLTTPDTLAADISFKLPVNDGSAGPVSISAGIAVTVPSGCSWTIV